MPKDEPSGKKNSLSEQSFGWNSRIKREYIALGRARLLRRTTKTL